MNSYFLGIKHDKTLNFQKKLIKKLTQLSFEKINGKSSCIVTICDHLKLFGNQSIASVLPFGPKMWVTIPIPQADFF